MTPRMHHRIETHVHEDDDIIAFARSWAPWGGGSSEDILVEFGLREAEYFERLRLALARPGATASLKPAQLEQLSNICAVRSAGQACPDIARPAERWSVG